MPHRLLAGVGLSGGGGIIGGGCSEANESGGGIGCSGS
jgi:hypothetical protein